MLKKIFIIFCLINCLKAKKSLFDFSNSNSPFGAGILTSLPTQNPTVTQTNNPIIPGSISFGAKTYTEFTFSFSKPTGMTGIISYKVYVSFPNTWTNINEVEANANIKQDYTSNISSFTITNLKPFQFYRVDLIAKDEKNVQVLYPYFCIQMDPNVTATVECKTELKGNVTTVVGSSSGNADGGLNTATLFQPQGMTTLGDSIYIADTSNHRIRKLNLTNQTLTTIAGSSAGYTNAVGTMAQFNGPIGITNDASNLFISDRSNHTIRKIDLNNFSVTTFVGPTTSTSGMVDGSGTTARFNSPNYIIYTGTEFYLSDEDNCRLRKITTAGVASVYAGGAACPGNTNSTLLSSSFSQDVVSVTYTSTHLYLTDFGNMKILKIDTNPAGSVTNFATGIAPYASVIYGKYMYVTEFSGNRIFKFDLDTGLSEVFAGDTSSGTTDGNKLQARFLNPRALVFLGSVLYVADTNNHRIRKID